MCSRPSAQNTLTRDEVTLSIGILGTGRVGTSIAISLLHGGVANSLLLSDLRADVAEGADRGIRRRR